MKVINAYTDHGITSDELVFTKSSIGQADACKYETNDQKAAFLTHIQQYDLKHDLIEEENKILTGISKIKIDELIIKSERW